MAERFDRVPTHLTDSQPPSVGVSFRSNDDVSSIWFTTTSTRPSLSKSPQARPRLPSGVVMPGQPGRRRRGSERRPSCDTGSSAARICSATDYRPSALRPRTHGISRHPANGTRNRFGAPSAPPRRWGECRCPAGAGCRVSPFRRSRDLGLHSQECLIEAAMHLPYQRWTVLAALADWVLVEFEVRHPVLRGQCKITFLD